MGFTHFVKKLLHIDSKGITPHPRYCIVGWSVGEEIGRIVMVVRSLQWAEVECARLNGEALSETVWHIAEIDPDVAIYGRTGLEDEG